MDLKDSIASDLVVAVEKLAQAHERMVHGDQYPSGIEALCMALMDGINDKPGVTDGLYAIASAITDLADAIRDKN